MRGATLATTLIIFASSFGWAKTEDVTTEDVAAQSAVAFDRPTLIKRDPEPPRKSLGLVTSLKGHGVVLEFPIARSRRVFADLIYTSTSNVRTADISPSNLVAVLEYEEKNRFELSFGLDQRLYFSESGGWGLFAGLNGGIHRSELESVFYPRVCGFWCGYDSNHPSGTDMTVDWALSSSYRLGARLYDVRVFGIKSDFAIIAVKSFVRWPKAIAVTAPDGVRDYAKFFERQGTLLFEANLTY